MKIANSNLAKPLIDVVDTIEKIVARRKLDKQFHRDEVEKYLSYCLQGQDPLDPYERRDAGFEDEQWNKLMNDLKKFIGLEEEKNEKSVFDF